MESTIIEKGEVLTPHKRLGKDYMELINKNITTLELPNNQPVIMNHSVDVGTSKTRSIAFDSQSKSINHSDIIRIHNQYSILNDSDIAYLKTLEFEESSYNNMLCIKMINLTNIANPFYNKQTTIAKGLVGEKLLKTNNFSVSNSKKYEQVEEYVINTYTSIVAQMYSNMVYFLEKGEVEKAHRCLNTEVSLSFMLPDEEKLSRYNTKLYKALQGTVEFELPMFKGLKGKFTVKDNKPTQWLEMYGEAECAIYYDLIKNLTPENKNIFKNHGVVVIDVGEGSIDLIFFKKGEVMERASSTSRSVNGSSLISRTTRNFEEECYKKGIKVNLTEESIKRVLEEDPENLMLVTPIASYDISEALNAAKTEMADEIANIFKTTFERNNVLKLEELFKVVFAGKTMSSCEKSPSLGGMVASRMEKQLGIPASICTVTHPDSNILGSALKMLMKIRKYRK